MRNISVDIHICKLKSEAKNEAQKKITRLKDLPVTNMLNTCEVYYFLTSLEINNIVIADYVTHENRVLQKWWPGWSEINPPFKAC